MLTTWIQAVYQFLWGDLLRIPLPGGSSFGVSLLIILLIPTGIYFTIRTRFLPVRLFGDMVRALTGKKKEDGSLSTFQTPVAFSSSIAAFPSRLLSSFLIPPNSLPYFGPTVFNCGLNV